MLLKSGIIVAFFTTLSRIFGLARELFIAAIFGSSALADCVNVAFKFPNLFRRIFGEGALSAVFIPIYSQKLSESKKSASNFSGEIITLLFIILVVLTLVMQIFMPYLMLIIAPGFRYDLEKYELAILLCRISTPYLIFVSITAIFGGMLNSVRKFAAFAFSPIIMSVCVILFTYSFSNIITAEIAIAYSLIFAGLLQVMFMYFVMVRAKILFSPSLNFKDKDLLKMLKKMGPAAMSQGVQQINLFISQSIASFLPGAISILAYADRIYQLPLALIGISFGTILLPELSQIYQKKDFPKANQLQNKAIIIGLGLSIPAMIGLFLLSAPIIQLIYQRGAFIAEDTLKTSYALAAFSLGLPAFVLAKILMPIFYANGDTKTPLNIMARSLILNTILNIIFMFPFGHTGIAIGSTIASWYNIYLINKYAKNYGNFSLTSKTKKIIYKIFYSSSIMLVFLIVLNYFYGYLYYHDNFWLRSGMLMIAIFLAMVIYLIILYFCKVHLLFYNKRSKKNVFS